MFTVTISYRKLIFVKSFDIHPTIFLRNNRKINKRVLDLSYMVTHSMCFDENYPDDVRGHSCLLLGYGENERPIHVVCSPKEEYLAIITVYLPYEEEWEDNFRTRKS